MAALVHAPPPRTARFRCWAWHYELDLDNVSRISSKAAAIAHRDRIKPARLPEDIGNDPANEGSGLRMNVGFGSDQKWRYGLLHWLRPFRPMRQTFGAITTMAVGEANATRAWPRVDNRRDSSLETTRAMWDTVAQMRSQY